MTGTHPEAAARMVDVSSKDITDREAEAAGSIKMQPATRDLVTAGELDKGDALEVARIAGIMAAKKTAELVPLCHPLPLDAIDVSIDEVDEGFDIRATVRTSARTGVEMEAMTAVAVCALTLYDMIKSVERKATITDIRLVRKTGGKSSL